MYYFAVTIFSDPTSITAITPNIPFIYGSSTSFRVPPGFSRNILTCTAFGWPLPTPHWTRNTTGDARIISETVIDRVNLGSISALLRFSRGLGFIESDAGNYTCVVQTNRSGLVQTMVVSLIFEPPSIDCSLNILTVYFAILLVGADCMAWEKRTSQNISSLLRDELVDAVNNECQDCSITSDHIAVISGPACSSQVSGATVFKGRISTEAFIFTEDIFCALTAWHQNEPRVFIGSTLYSINQGCPLRLISPNHTECVDNNTRFSLGSAALGAVLVVAVILLLLVIDGFFVLLYYFVRLRRYIATCIVLIVK